MFALNRSAATAATIPSGPSSRSTAPLVSYFSDIPPLEGMLGGDPLALDVVMARLEHLRSLLRAALQPETERVLGPRSRSRLR